MTKHLHVSLILLIMGACAACSSGSMPTVQPAANTAIERALLASIRLHSKSGRGYCAGTRFSPELVATAYHCAVAGVIPHELIALIEAMGGDINDVPFDELVGKKLLFSTYSDSLDKDPDDATTFKVGFIEAGDAVSDIAVFRTAKSEQPYATVSSAPLRVGQTVFEIGHPGGEIYAYTRGYVSTPCRKHPDKCMVQADITSWFGSSGGGLFNEAGELVGVCSALSLAELAGGDVVGHPGLTLFGPAEALEALLTTNTPADN